MNDFRKALLATAIPVGVLAVVSSVGMKLARTGAYQYEYSGAFWAVWLSAVGLWVIALIAGIVLSVRRKGQIAAGIFAGVGIGIAALGATCFSNVIVGL